MKRIIFILSIFMITISCNSLSTSEKSIQEYMRTQTGSPDLEIEFTNVQITKQTVGDSIDILQKIFEEQIKEKEKTIKRPGKKSWNLCPKKTKIMHFWFR